MWGTFGIISSRQNVAPRLLKGLTRLERGISTSTGIAVIQEGVLRREWTGGRASQLESNIEEDFAGSAGIAHTHGLSQAPSALENPSPYFDHSGAIAVVQSGTVENYTDIREILEEEGLATADMTDAELVVHLIAGNNDGNMTSAVQKTMWQLQGAFSLQVLAVGAPHELYACHKGSPLAVGIGHGEYLAASDVSPILEHTRRVLHLYDGEMAQLTSIGYRTMTFNDVPTVHQVEEVPWEWDDTDPKNLDRSLLNDIFERR